MCSFFWLFHIRLLSVFTQFSTGTSVSSPFPSQLFTAVRHSYHTALSRNSVYNSCSSTLSSCLLRGLCFPLWPVPRLFIYGRELPYLAQTTKKAISLEWRSPYSSDSCRSTDPNYSRVVSVRIPRQALLGACLSDTARCQLLLSFVGLLFVSYFYWFYQIALICHILAKSTQLFFFSCLAPSVPYSWYVNSSSLRQLLLWLQPLLKVVGV